MRIEMCATMRVMRRGEVEPVIVNAADFDPATMEPWAEAAECPPVAPAPQAIPEEAPAVKRSLGRPRRG